MDISKYRKQKGKGLVQIFSAGTAHLVVQRRFDPFTGEETAPEMQGIDLEQIKQRRQELIDQLAELDAFIADLEAAKPQPGSLQPTEPPNRVAKTDKG